MKNTIKLNKTIKLIGIMLLAFLSTAEQAIAAGSAYSPYSPYGEHLPADTGIVGMDFLSILGIVLYIGGLVSLISTKTIRDKVSKIINK